MPVLCSYDVLSALLDANPGAVNVKDRNAETPLMAAVRGNHADCVA